MSADQSKRPRFYEEQFLGADDLTALVDYGRVARARHDLGAHVWGIAMGLQLVERPSKSGDDAVDVFIQPGYAWDGYGRPIALLAPFKLPTSFFTMAYDSLIDDGTPKGRLLAIWLRYCETPVGGPASGFEVCVASDQYSRIFESFRIDIGPKETHAERHDGVTVAGRSADAAQIVQKIGSASDPLVADESIAYQDFPDDHGEARWFIPLGVVRWLPNQVASQPGSFVALSAGDQVQSDRRRRYIGAVAETLNAPRGFVRVRDRALAMDPTVWSDDRLWVEGMLRVDGDAKILAGVLAFRNASNADLNAPLTIGRFNNNPLGGHDMQVQLGTDGLGHNRLVVGARIGAASAVSPGLVVTDAASVGVGVGDPNKPLTIRAQRVTEEAIGLQSPDGTPRWHINLKAGGKAGLNFVETGVQDGRLFLQPGGNCGLMTMEPTHPLHVAANAGIRQNRLYMSGGGDGTDHWSSLSYNAHHNATNSAWVYPDPSRKAVTIEMDDSGGTPRFQVWSTTDASKTSWVQRLAVDGESGNVVMGLMKGNLGVGAPAPENRLELNLPSSTSPIKAMSIDVTSFVTGSNAAASHFFRVRDLGAPSTPFLIRGDGRVGVGTDAPGAQLHATSSLTVGPFGGVNLATGSLNVTGPSAELGFVSRALTQWPSNAPAKGDRFVWYNPDGTARLWANGDLLTVTSGGSLGVATTDPKCTLHVVGNKSADETQVESHIALIENTANTGDSDVLALRIAGDYPPDYGNNFITFFTGANVAGSVQGNQLGAYFNLFGADYAEWLPRLDPDETMAAGDIVGVFGGAVTKRVEGADQIMVLSTAPAMLGNRPHVRDPALNEMVGFLGQLPARVRGVVQAGDYILASRDGGGVGIAVPPADLEPEDLPLVVGTAWEASDDDAVKTVRTAVGVPLRHAWETVMAHVRELRRDVDQLRSAESHQGPTEARASHARASRKTPSREEKKS